MRIIHLPVKRNAELDLKKLEALKGRIGIVYTSQYSHLTGQVQKKLGRRGMLGGQVLGCNVRKAEMKCDSILLLSDGEFHALEIARVTGKPVYIFNEAGLKKLDGKKVKLLEKKKWARIAKAKRAKHFGFIASVKPGQNKLREVERIAGSNYVFVCDTINYSELLNFPFIDCWVNTACPRIIEDDPGVLIINMEEFLETRKT